MAGSAFNVLYPLKYHAFSHFYVLERQKRKKERKKLKKTFIFHAFSTIFFHLGIDKRINIRYNEIT